MENNDDSLGHIESLVIIELSPFYISIDSRDIVTCITYFMRYITKAIIGSIKCEAFPFVC